MMACGFCADESCWVMDGACDCECHAIDERGEQDQDCLGCGQCQDCIRLCIENDPAPHTAETGKEEK